MKIPKKKKGTKKDVDDATSSNGSFDASSKTTTSGPSASPATNGRSGGECGSPLSSSVEEEVEILRRHILSCPGLSKDSNAVRGALEGLESSLEEERRRKAADRGTAAATATTKEMEEEETASEGDESPIPRSPIPRAPDASSDGDDDDGGGAASIEPIPPKRKSRRTSLLFLLSTLLLFLRIVALDVPLTTILVVRLSLAWLLRVHRLYLGPQIELMTWTDDRKSREFTYYARQCDATDVSTRNVSDLIVDPNATVEEAVDRMLKHGASVYPSVLRDDTADQLRSYVLAENAKLSEEDAIWVIGNEHRWSFGIGAVDDPIVTKALREIATHPSLRPALEAIIGPDPALIEMTAITSAYGAADQFWHADVVPKGSTAKYGRSFVPSYSVFIPLQDTTAAMGATDVCPGTHPCANEDVPFCADVGFRVSGSDPNGVWRKGDAVLMNQMTRHRGASHVDKDGPHRSVFIVTFATRPLSSGETRMIGQGGSYSARWDQWGHTLSDVEDADRRMIFPWTALRSLGLYKPPNRKWGWDYPSQVSMRIANWDTNYDREDLDVLIEERGGFLKHLPTFLHGEVKDDESWEAFLVDTARKCEAYAKKCHEIGLGSYFIAMLLCALIARMMRRRSRRTPKAPSGAADADEEKKEAKRSVLATLLPRTSVFRKAILRVTIVHTAAALLTYSASRAVDRTNWAKDIAAKRLYSSPFPEEPVTSTSSLAPAAPKRPTTLPTKRDILFGARYDAEFLASYDRILEYHPGNRLYLDSIRRVAPLCGSYSDLPVVFRDRLIETIVEGTTEEGGRGRFLAQNWSTGDWGVLSRPEAKLAASRDLAKAFHPALASLDRGIEHLLSKSRFDSRRGAATMGSSHARVRVEKLCDQLFAVAAGGDVVVEVARGTTAVRRDAPPAGPAPPRPSILSPRALNVASSRSRVVRPFETKHAWSSAAACKKRRSNLPMSATRDDAASATIRAPLQEGDVVEGKYRGQFDEWYKGKISGAYPWGQYSVQYDDGESDTNLDPRHVRPFVQHPKGEYVEAQMVPGSIQWFPGRIRKVRTNGTYDVVLDVDGKDEVVRGVKDTSIRRVEHPTFELGERIEAKYNGAGDVYYEGWIDGIHGDGTYDIAYVDGDRDPRLDERFVRRAGF